MDLAALYRRLESATFSQREQIAAEVVREATPDEIAGLARGLGHPHAAVRLGVIEIVRSAGCRKALPGLLTLARAAEGDERVFAVRAMAQLARPGDDFLAEPAARWLRSGDAFLETHAGKLVAALGRSRAAAAPAATPERSAPGGERAAVSSGEPLEQLVVRLFSAVKGTERIALIDAIERRGPAALYGAAKVVFQKGGEDLVALLARAAIRQAAVRPPPEALLAALEAARRRLGNAPVAAAAIDDALLALGGAALSPALLARLGQLEAPQLEEIGARLVSHPADEVALHAPALLDAIGKDPARWRELGPALAHAAPHLREESRAELRRLIELLLAELRRRKPQPPAALTSACAALAHLAEPGEPLPRQLRSGLERLAGADAARALCALCARLATEEAGAVLVAMLRDPLPEARRAAREAIQAWRSPWVQIAAADGATEPALTAAYTDGAGRPLERRGGRLFAPDGGSAGGDEHVLDGRGRPVPAADTELGGCLCCAPPRALVRRRREGLRCPASWESHLRDGARTLLEKEHPLGRCHRCDSGRPRVRDGARTICLDCGAGLGALGPVDDLAPQPAPEGPPLPSERGGGHGGGRGGGRRDRRAERDDELPSPPTPEELEHVAPHIRAAIVANVFLDARVGDQRWNGSGIIIARDGEHVAILTNRHVVEDDESQELCAMRAMTVSGEAGAVRAIWRARRGIDLALVEGRVRHPERVGAMELGAGAVLVGAEVFAIGNPLGLAWSYTAGTLSAIRNWTTQDGQSVRILQTDANIAPGSSGGGLFHSEGHLLGVMSFLRQGPAGGSAHFALSVPAVREALARDGVRWRGRALGDPPAQG